MSAEANLRTQATAELNKLLNTAGQAEIIAHITEAQQRAELAFEVSMNMIEQAQVPVLPPIDVVAPNVAVINDPPPKKRRLVDVKALWRGGFIETSDQMEQFIEKLRNELQSAIEADQRVQLK
jgi:hypothetical protein